MGRAKIPMEPMTDPKKRKATFNARHSGMIKKARELTTLCDVKVSIIIFTDHDQKIFPPDHNELMGSIEVYNRARLANPESIKRYSLLDYYADRKMKVEEELVKEKKKILEFKFPSWFGFLDGLSEAGLREFALGLEDKIVDVQSRLECLKNTHNVGLGLFNNNQQMMTQSWNPNLKNPNNIMGPSDSLMKNVQMFSGDVDDNVIMMPQLYPDSMMNIKLNEEDVDGNVSYDDDDGDNFSLPLMEQYCFPHHQSFQQLLMSGFQ